MDKSINQLIDTLIEDEKEKFQPGIESFQMHAAKVRAKASDAMAKFQQKFQRGYHLMRDALATQPQLTAVLEQGKLHILNASNDLLLHCYEIARSKTREKEFEK